MDKYKYIFLSIFAGLLLVLSIVSALAEPNTEVTPEAEAILENNISDPLIENLTSSSSEILTLGENTSINETNLSNVTGLISQEIELNLDFLTSMLQMLDLNLNLINETLNAHVEEFPFLKPTIEGTGEGIKTVDNVLVILNFDSNNTSDSNVTLHSLNGTMAEINSSLVYPQGMVESANITMGNPNYTTPMIGNMFTSIKGMFSLLEQF